MNKSILALLFSTIIILVGCTEIEEKTTEVTEDTNGVEEIISKDKNTIFKESMSKIPINFNQYRIPENSCYSSPMIAPSYIDNENIIFLDSNEDTYSIMAYSKTKDSCEVLYQAKGIGQIVGELNTIYWTEYDTSKYTDVDWTIKSIDLDSKKVSEIYSGRSEKETPPPVLKINKKNLSWIEYIANGEIVESVLMHYSLISNELSVISSVQLDETGLREGSYLISNMSLDDNKEIIYKSIFTNGEKKLELYLVSDDEQQKLITRDNILDYTSNDNFLVYTGEGQLTVQSLKDTDYSLNYFTGDTLTTDSPIFINDNQLLFRYSMNDIILIDLNNKTYQSILSDLNSTISKPIYNDNILSFGKIDTDNQVYFVEVLFNK